MEILLQSLLPKKKKIIKFRVGRVCVIVRRCTAWHCVCVKHTTVKMYDIVCFTTTKIHISNVCNEMLHIHVGY